ncbi:MAG TPA: DedA family protein [Anaeromyxobacteraceae bacterium]|nr:DedA family protein [Anaeromyxobacteraceae bacterium]
MERATEALQAVLSRTGPAAPLILFMGSLIEYVFPPFPGDTVVVLGAWYAVKGVLSWPMTFGAVTAGAVLGAWIDFRVGVALGAALEKGAQRRGPITVEHVRRVEEGYRRYGAWFLLANRFLPAVRAFLFVGAGAARLPLRRVLLYGGISAALWNAILLALGAFVVSNLNDLLAVLERYTTVAWVLMATAAAVALVRWVLVRRRGRA